MNNFGFNNKIYKKTYLKVKQSKINNRKDSEFVK